ncbi:MAG: efflux RND transporter periplasmic adaptor subunit [Chloroflexi bacterium]|nr:efflux RND transporter periplasmic adaptor subunit [Chloroflexota bacterium]
MTRRRIVMLLLAAIVPLIIGGIIAGIAIWYQSQSYVTAASARVSGPVIQVTTPASGRITWMPFDTGQTVTAGQTIARLQIAMPIAPNSTITTMVTEPIEAPRAGTIIRRYLHAGERAAAGAVLFNMVNLSDLYVVAEIDETHIGLVHIGEPASVYLPAFDQTINGVVNSLTPATNDLITAIAGNPASGAAASGSTPLIPVIIDIDNQGFPIVPGMTAQVTIQVTH